MPSKYQQSSHWLAYRKKYFKAHQLNYSSPLKHLPLVILTLFFAGSAVLGSLQLYSYAQQSAAALAEQAASIAASLAEDASSSSEIAADATSSSTMALSNPYEPDSAAVTSEANLPSLPLAAAPPTSLANEPSSTTPAPARSPTHSPTRGAAPTIASIVPNKGQIGRAHV